MLQSCFIIDSTFCEVFLTHFCSLCFLKWKFYISVLAQNSEWCIPTRVCKLIKSGNINFDSILKWLIIICQTFWKFSKLFPINKSLEKRKWFRLSWLATMVKRYQYNKNHVARHCTLYSNCPFVTLIYFMLVLPWRLFLPLSF